MRAPGQDGINCSFIDYPVTFRACVAATTSFASENLGLLHVAAVLAGLGRCFHVIVIPTQDVAAVMKGGKGVGVGGIEEEAIVEELERTESKIMGRSLKIKFDLQVK